MALRMQDVPSPRIRTCTGRCRQGLPETVEFFYQDPKTYIFAACCRKCRAAHRLEQRAKSQGNDGLRGGMGETRTKVKEAFRRIDPRGSEQNELRGRLKGIVRRFAGMDYEQKAKEIAWLVTEFFKPQTERNA